MAKSLFDKQVALFSSFFLAISPWHVHLSRVATEGLMPFLFFTTTGVYLFAKSKQKVKLLPLSFLFLAIGSYSYFSARIFIPIFLLILVILYRRFLTKNKKIVLLSFTVFIIISLPLIFHMFFGPGLTRWHQVSIFINKDFLGGVTQMPANYLLYFSPQFLFSGGDAGFPGQFIKRHSILGIGELYWFQLPLIIIAVLSSLIVRKKEGKLLLFWLLLYPLAGTITKETTPQATRSVIGVIPFQILSAIGTLWLLGFFKKRPSFFQRKFPNSYF
jgi:4-amino-4-deoxy-L-arabinose transferase-like glycosyltransferase